MNRLTRHFKTRSLNNALEEEAALIAETNYWLHIINANEEASIYVFDCQAQRRARLAALQVRIKRLTKELSP